jgi:hypothetical protein
LFDVKVYFEDFGEYSFVIIIIGLFSNTGLLLDKVRFFYALLCKIKFLRAVVAEVFAAFKLDELVSNTIAVLFKQTELYAITCIACTLSER